jgi:hypothetical protein
MAMTAWLAKFSKLNLLVVEGTDLLPVNRERPDQVLFLEHRHDDKRPNADLAEGVAVVLAEIGNRLVIGNKAAREPHHLNVPTGDTKAGRLPRDQPRRTQARPDRVRRQTHRLRERNCPRRILRLAAR